MTGMTDRAFRGDTGHRSTEHRVACGQGCSAQIFPAVRCVYLSGRLIDRDLGRVDVAPRAHALETFDDHAVARGHARTHQPVAADAPADFQDTLLDLIVRAEIGRANV